MTLEPCRRICAARLQLEPLMESHASALFPLFRDEGLWEFIDEAPPVSLLALRARYRRLESRRSADGTQLWLNWPLVLNDGSVIGVVQATGDRAPRSGVWARAKEMTIFGRSK